jgi:membrane fusion protein (multidrug efflux system)
MKNLLTSFTAIMLFTACHQPGSPHTRQREFPVTTLTPIDTVAYTEYSAEIHAVQYIELRARVSGYLDKIHIDEGKVVKQGQLLFSINDIEYQEELTRSVAALKNALAELGNAEIAFKSAKRLVEKNVVSEAEMNVALNKLEAARARAQEARSVEALARQRLSYTQVRAPFSGKVNRISHKIGSLIREGTLLTTISQDKEVFAYFNVSEKEYLNYAFNLEKDSVHSNEVSLILATGKEHAYKGVIETVESEIDKNTGNIAFRARFKNPHHILKHGASGKIRLTKKYNDVIVIPQKSTFEIQDKIYVYLVDRDNTVKTRVITALNPLPHLYVVSSGLAAGDRIIYEGIQNVKEGQKIIAEPVSMSDILKQLAAL